MKLKTLQTKKLNIISLFLLLLSFALMVFTMNSHNVNFAIIFYTLTILLSVLYGLSIPQKEKDKIDYKIKEYEQTLTVFCDSLEDLLEQSENNEISITSLEFEIKELLNTMKTSKERISYFGK